MKEETSKTLSPSFSPSLQCYDCPEVKRLDMRINMIDVKLNGLLTTTLTTLVLAIGGLITWLL